VDFNAGTGGERVYVCFKKVGSSSSSSSSSNPWFSSDYTTTTTTTTTTSSIPVHHDQFNSNQISFDSSPFSKPILKFRVQAIH